MNQRKFKRWILSIYATRPNEWTFGQIIERYGDEISRMCDEGTNMTNENVYDVKLDYNVRHTCLYNTGTFRNINQD